MNRTIEHYPQISEMLTKLGIEHVVSLSVFMIDRTSMVRASPGSDEDTAYRVTLDLIKELCGPEMYVMWAMRADDWMSLDVYVRPRPEPSRHHHSCTGDCDREVGGTYSCTR